MAFLFLDKRNVIIGSVVLAVIFSLGIIIGYYGRQMPDSSGSKGDLISEGIFTFLLKISNEMCEITILNIFYLCVLFIGLSFSLFKLKRQQKTSADICCPVFGF